MGEGLSDFFGSVHFHGEISPGALLSLGSGVFIFQVAEGRVEDSGVAVWWQGAEFKLRRARHGTGMSACTVFRMVRRLLGALTCDF